MAKITLTLELDSTNAKDTISLAAIVQAFNSTAASTEVASKAIQEVGQAVATAKPAPIAEYNTPATQATPASAPAATVPLKVVAPVVPKAVMPTVPKAVMPTAPAATAPAAQVTAAVNAATANTADEPTVTIKELRELMAEKVTTHVEVLRAKLAELGTANISAMKPEYYNEFYAYLQSLA